MISGSSSHAKLENKLNLLIAEIRGGKREGSVVSTKTFDTAAQNDQETWEALRRELEDIGISPSVITEKRHFIIAWFQEAVAAGKLEEDSPSIYNESAISPYTSDCLSSKFDDNRVSNREMSSVVTEPRATEGATVKGSGPKAQRSPGQPAKPAYLLRSLPSLLSQTIAYLQRPLPSSPLPLQRNEKSQIWFSDSLTEDKRFLEAAMAGDIPRIMGLLERGVYIQVRGLQGQEKATALHLATSFMREDTVRLLLLKGADVNAMSENSKTALHQAVDDGNEQITRLLLEKGADTESKDSSGNTALAYAAAGGREAVVQLLLEKGADVESKNSSGDSALIWAAKTGHASIVRLLLQHGANVESEDSDGDTALILAVRGGHLLVVWLLIEKGVDVESRNSRGDTAILCAAIYGRGAMAQLLLDHGAKLDTKNLQGETALWNAARGGHVSMVRLLLEKGVDVESQNSDGNTALICAAIYEREATVQLLLDKGAKLDAENNLGETALFYAEENRDKTVAHLLRNAGARG